MADERNVDLLRLTVERDLERMKAEVASAKAELQAIKTELVQQVADAKVEIGERAIEKMYKAFSEFRTWAIVGVSLFFTIGGVTAYQIYTGARHIVESRIDDWLSFDKKGALLKESLEGIRTRVVLDGLVTQMERSRIDRSPRSPLTISPAEESRLVAYMLEPNTSETDFRDGARVLGASIGIFYPGIKSDFDKLLSSTLTRFRADSYRPSVLLTALRHYQGTVEYANNILKAKNVPDDIRYSAFNVLSGFYSNDAQKYATANLLTESYAPLQDAEAMSLADDTASANLVDQWLVKKSAQGDGVDARVMLADKISLHVSSLNMAPTDQKWMVSRISSLIDSAIFHGAKLYFSDSIPSHVALGFKTDKATQFRQCDWIFDDGKILMPAMAKKALSEGIPADVFVRALTTRGSRGEIFGLSVILNTASLTGEAFGIIDDGNVAGPLLLVADDNAPTPTINVSFRAKDGRWITDHVKSFSNFYSANLSFAYDQAVLEMTKIHDLNDFDDLP